MEGANKVRQFGNPARYTWGIFGANTVGANTVGVHLGHIRGKYCSWGTLGAYSGQILQLGHTWGIFGANTVGANTVGAYSGQIQLGHTWGTVEAKNRSTALVS